MASRERYRNRKSVTAEFSLARRKEVKASIKYRIKYKHKNQYSINQICKIFSSIKKWLLCVVKKADYIRQRFTACRKDKRMSERKP